MEPITEMQLGARLEQAYPDKLKIALHVVCRTAIAIVICLAGSGGIHGMDKWFDSAGDIAFFLGMWVVFLVIGLFPLIHLRDSLVFYENGICYHGRNYLFSQLGSVRFRDYKSGIMTHCMMDTDLRTFDVTYLERPKRQFNKAYMNQTAPQNSQTRF